MRRARRMDDERLAVTHVGEVREEFDVVNQLDAVRLLLFRAAARDAEAHDDKADDRQDRGEVGAPLALCQPVAGHDHGTCGTDGAGLVHRRDTADDRAQNQEDQRKRREERENDLVLGTFGRGFYVMDDYSVLRDIENSDISEDAIIYPIRTALIWEKSSPLGLPGKSFQGDNFYTAPNLGPEAMITYYYGSDFKSLKDQRQKKEKELIKSGSDTPYPSYTDLKAEVEEDKQELVFTIKDANGRVVKKVFKPAKKGVQRFHWDLRYILPDPIVLSTPSFYNPFGGRDEGTLVAPGTYTVEMALMKDGVLESLTSPRSFEIKALNNTELPAEDRAEKVAFQKSLSQLAADFGIVQNLLSESRNKVRYMKAAIKRAEQPLGPLTADLRAIEKQLDEVQLAMYGDPVKRRLDIDQPPSPASRLGSIGYEQKYSTATPTQTHRDSYAIAKDEVRTIKSKMERIFNEDIKNLEQKLINAGAPYTPGRGYENDN